MLTSYLGVGGCREEKCVSLVPTCRWVSGCVSLVPTCNVLASYLGVRLLPRCGWVSEGEMVYLGGGGYREKKSLLPRCGLVSGDEMF